MRKTLSCLMVCGLFLASTVSFGSDGAPTTEDPIVIVDDLNFDCDYEFAYINSYDLAYAEVIGSVEVAEGVHFAFVSKVELSSEDLEVLLDNLFEPIKETMAPEPRNTETTVSYFSSWLFYPITFHCDYAIEHYNSGLTSYPSRE